MKVILASEQSPGDIVMLTAAVRDLQRQAAGRFLVDVRTPCAPLWENNPYLTPLSERDTDVKMIRCEYPLIHRSNNEPWHFIHGYHQFLSERLGVRLEPTDFQGDIHLHADERQWISQVEEITGAPMPFWIVVAGGKTDFTAKLWDPVRWQTVIDQFRERILFVQIGEASHVHPPLRGVLDLRGMTTLRQLVRLVYHAQGVLCPVTLAMHLAAAVPTKPGMPKNRPCVVVAGGREPPQWEAYPHHQYIHTNGALACCDNGGCWKSRVVPLGDGDTKDGNLCVDVVELATGRRQSGHAWASEGITPYETPRSQTGNGANGMVNAIETSRWLPRCLDMITAEDVIRRIDMYFRGGAVSYLTAHQTMVAAKTIPALQWGASVAAIVPPGSGRHLIFPSPASLAVCLPATPDR